MPGVSERGRAQDGQRSAGHRIQLRHGLTRPWGRQSHPGRGDRVTIDSIRNHASRHFPVQNVAKATYREIVERRAQEAQIDFVNGVLTALTPVAFYEVVMNEAFRRLMD